MGSMYLEREDKIGETNEETNTAGLGLGWDHFGNTAWVGLVLDWFNSWVGVAWTGTWSGLVLQPVRQSFLCAAHTLGLLTVWPGAHS